MALKKKVPAKQVNIEKKRSTPKPAVKQAARVAAKKAAEQPKPKTKAAAKSKPKPVAATPKTKPVAAPKSNPKSTMKSTPASKSVAKEKSKAKPAATPAPATKTKARDKSVTVAPQTKASATKSRAPKAAAKAQAAETTTKSHAKASVPDEATQDSQASGSRRQSGANLKFLVTVAQAIKDAVAPLARAVKGREVVDEAPSGDVTFLLDRVAEKALFQCLKAAALPIAYYSEHEGYSTFSSKQPKSLLIVDPIDGTRAAKSGFEGCVVAVASTRVIERPTIADIDCACVMDLLGNRIFLAERGKGARIYVGGRLKRPKLSDNTDLESMCWSMTIPARPAELIFPTAARIIDLSSLKGGFFACNSTSFSLTRLVTNQLDACVDIANRYYRDIPDRVEDYFINAGRGKVIGVAPYDIAASLLIAEEAGCVVTDAYGNRFNNLLLLDSSKGNHQSIIAAANAPLHEKLLNFFDTRIKQYELLLTRHAGRE